MLLRLLCLIILISLLNGCKKDLIQTTTFTSAEDALALPDNKTVARTSTVDKVITLTIQPDKTDGQDAWIDYKASDPSYENGHSNTLSILKTVAWTEDGEPVLSRSLIKFDSLSIVPPTAKISSAKLYLYGLSSTTPYLPQGNSVYPGSSAASENTVAVRRIVKKWNAKTVTWKTRPTSTDTNQVIIPSSTSQWNYNVVVDVKKLIAPMVTNPAINYGFLLKLVNEQYYRSMGFYSSDYGSASKRPKLVVVYREN